MLQGFSWSWVQEVLPTMLGWKWIAVDVFNTIRNETDRKITLRHIQSIWITALWFKRAWQYFTYRSHLSMQTLISYSSVFVAISLVSISVLRRISRPSRHYSPCGPLTWNLSILTWFSACLKLYTRPIDCNSTEKSAIGSSVVPHSPT